MLKIKYHKLCHKHDEVRELKRQLIKSYKIVEDFSYIYLSIELSGVKDVDFKEIQFYIDRQYEKLRDRMSREIENNREIKRSDSYSLSENIIVLKYLTTINEIMLSIDCYPVIPQKIVDFEFKSQNEEERYNEAKRFFQGENFEGFNKKWFVVDQGKEERLQPLFFKNSDLSKGEMLRLKYQ